MIRSGPAIALLCAALAGCTVHSIRLDNAEYARFDASRPSEVSSETCGLLLGGIPFRLGSHLLRAQRNLESRATDSVFTNVRVQERWVWIGAGPLFCTKLWATAYPKVH